MSHAFNSNTRPFRSSRSVLSRLAAAGFSCLVLAATAAAQTSYCQQSPPWGGEALGRSSLPFWRYGCAATCFADIATNRKWRVTPHDINQNKNLFSGPNIYWDAAAQAIGYRGTSFYDYSNVAADLNKIYSLIDAGKPLIVETRLGGSTHFVTVLSRSNSTLWTLDPWYGDVVSFSSRYGSPARWIYSVRALN